MWQPIGNRAALMSQRILSISVQRALAMTVIPIINR